MEICVVNYLFTRTGGGGQYRSLGIARQLERFGFKVTLCCSFFCTNSLYEFPDITSSTYVTSFYDWLHREYMNTVELIRRFRSCRGSYDLVLVELPCPASRSLTALYNKLLGRRTFIDIADVWHSPHSFLRICEDLWMKKVCEKADKVSVATMALKEHVINAFSLKKRVKHIPCGVDLTIFDPKKTGKIEIPQIRGKYVILYSGSIRTFTGCHYLPEIAKEVSREKKDVVFLVVGEGEYLPQLKIKVQEKGLSEFFMFTGPIAHNMVPSYISVADVCLNLSPLNMVTNLGVFPIKIPEYMAMGKPVVSTAIREVKNIINDGRDGFYCSPQKIGGKIINLLEDRELRRRIGENARKKAASRYSWEVLVKDLVDFWEIGGCGI